MATGLHLQCHIPGLTLNFQYTDGHLEFIFQKAYF